MINNEDEIKSLFNEWSQALKTGEPKKVTSLYEENSILLPTASNKVRYNREEIEDYFDQFLALKPVCTLDKATVRLCGAIAVNSGVYSFSFVDGSLITARFTFIYRKVSDKWMIMEHHSSQMPEAERKEEN